MDELTNNGEEEDLISNVINLSKYVLGRVKDQLEPFLLPLMVEKNGDSIDMRPEKYHTWFCLFCDPRYVNNMHPVKKLFDIKGRTDLELRQVNSKMLSIFFMRMWLL